MFDFFKKKKVPLFPEGVDVQQKESIDSEVLESWVRICHKNHAQFHSVDAVRVDDEEFPWYVYFSAGEFIREEPYVSILNNAIARSLSSVEGVEEAFHEDTEKYVISGSPQGEDLVRTVSEAIDLFMEENLEKWEAAVRS